MHHSSRAISEIQWVKFSLKVVLAIRVRGRPEMTSSFDLFWSLLYRLSVVIFCLSLSVEKLFNIPHLAGESSLG
jgi:hypothetical protein